jgi:hypothetical protein
LGAGASPEASGAANWDETSARYRIVWKHHHISMNDVTNIRAKDYIEAKGTFRDTLIELRAHMENAGVEWSDKALVDSLIAASSEALLSDPNIHYPDNSLSCYGAAIGRDLALLQWEERGLLPIGFARRGQRAFDLVGRHRIRYENPNIRDEDISYGLYHQFPKLISFAKASLP